MGNLTSGLIMGNFLASGITDFERSLLARNSLTSAGLSKQLPQLMRRVACEEKQTPSGYYTVTGKKK